MGDLLRRRTTRTNPCIYLFCHLLKMMYSARLKIISNHPLWMSISLYTVSCHLIRCICSSTFPMKTFLWSHKKFQAAVINESFFSFQPLKIPYLFLHCLPHVKKYVLGRLRHLPLARKELCLSSELSSSFMTAKALWLRQARKSVLKGPFRLQVLLRTVRCWPKSNERRLHIIISYEVENTFTFCNIHKFECTRLFWFGRL